MGVVNVTPDSFWSPSRVSGVEEACRRMAEMRAQGADIIDIGAVSSRPGAAEVPEEEEWARLEPVLCGIDGSVRISIDTTRSAIIRRAVTLLGAKLGEKYAKTLMVNDISAGEDDCEMLDTAASYGLTYVAMHKRGTPADMDGRTDYGGGWCPALNHISMPSPNARGRPVWTIGYLIPDSASPRLKHRTWNFWTI